MMNNVNLIGRLADTPKLTYTTVNSIPVANFAIAVQRRVGKDKEKVVDFFRVVAWQGTAEFVSKNFKKGQPIGIEGRLQQRSWVDEATGVTRYVIEIVAQSVHFAGYLKDDQPDQNDQTNQATQTGNPGYGANFDPFSQQAA